METQRAVVVKVGVELGSLTLYGWRDDDSWMFATEMRDQSPLLIDEEPVTVNSPTVVSWDAALALLDKYPWADLYPVAVHPDFREAVWTAVRSRVGKDRRGEEWRKICGQP